MRESRIRAADGGDRPVEVDVDIREFDVVVVEQYVDVLDESALRAVVASDMERAAVQDPEFVFDCDKIEIAPGLGVVEPDRVVRAADLETAPVESDTVTEATGDESVLAVLEAEPEEGDVILLLHRDKGARSWNVIRPLGIVNVEIPGIAVEPVFSVGVEFL